MTYGEKLFWEEVKTRGLIGKGAHKKRGGSRSKKCTLPSDHLTQKQRKELNGQVETYRLSEPMSWVEFLRLPTDIQKEYLNSLVRNYGARRTDVLSMFGISSSTMHRYVQDKLGGMTPWDNTSPKKPTKAWLDFVSQGDAESGAVSKATEDENVDQKPCSCVKHSEGDKATSEALILDGRIALEGYPLQIFQRALFAFETEKKYRVQIAFSVVEETGAMKLPE